MPTNLEKIAEMRRKFRNCMVFIEPKSIEQAHADFDALLSAIAEEIDFACPGTTGGVLKPHGGKAAAFCNWNLHKLAALLRGEEKK